MKLKDIADMKEYLKNRCYCPGEIYDITGFFFQVFSPDTECKKFLSGEREHIHGDFVIAQAEETYDPQIILIQHKDGVVEFCERYDATENNIKQLTQWINKEIDKVNLDEFEPGATSKNLKQIFNMCDAVMI